MEFGKRLLPQVVDHYAQHEPDRVYASIPVSTSDLGQGFRDVSMARLSSMANRMAWWLEDILGVGHLNTIAYLGPADIRYAVVFLAAVKSGYKVLFISPRNQLAQNKSMLVRSECIALLYAEELASAALPLVQGLPQLVSRPVSSLIDLLDTPDHVKHYPFDKSFDDARDEPCLILHSSGSTGDPKLVTMTHGTFAVTDNDRNMPVPEGRKAQNAAQFNFAGGGKFYSCFPPYHLAGVHAYIDLPIFSTSATVVFGPTQLPPSGYLLSEILKHQRVRSFYVPPFIIEQWFDEPIAAEQAQGVDFILYGGGPLNPRVGDRLSEVTNVCQMYGSLEVGQVQMLVPEKGNWSYMELNPFEEADMQPAGDGAFEMVLHQEDPKFADRRSLWHNFPGIKEWRTGDLFVPHPSLKGLWRFHSRVDDLIVLSSSHKIRPLEMETIIQGDPLLSGALICGQGRSEPLLIVEPKPQAYDGERDTFVDKIWPTIEEANKIAPTYARLSRSKLLIARPDAPFIRAPKGSIVRKLTIKAYEDDIEAAYGGTDTAAPKTNGVAPAQGSIVPFLYPGVKDFVRKHVEASLPGISSVSDTDNVFLLGLDSLGCMGLSRSLAEGIEMGAGQGPSFAPRIVYAYPTIERLAHVVLSMILGIEVSGVSTTTSDLNSMRLAVDEFTKDLPLPSRTTAETNGHVLSSRSDGLVVALLGPRGSLGPHVVKELLSNPRVTKIYCLSRGEDSRERMRTIFTDLHIPCNADDERLVFFPMDLGKPKLGLSDDHHNELLQNVNLVIHNAWKVDFSWTLESYKPVHLRGVRDLVDFSANSSVLPRPRIVFVSSVASVQGWEAVHPGELVTEEAPESYEVASSLGYGQSKHVSERMLAQAAQDSHVPVTILRLGQVAGSTTVSGGRWSLDEWLPALTSLSIALETIPSDLPPIDWIPVDVTAKAVSELATASEVSGRGAEVFNLVNPQLSDWAVYKGVLHNHTRGRAREVPFTEWVSYIAETKHDVLEVKGVGTLAARMLPFFEHLVDITNRGVPMQPRFETSRTVRASNAMATLGPVDEALVEVWFKQWGYA